MSRMQSALEERVNGVSHAVGALLALIGWGWLLARAFSHGSGISVLAISLFCLALVAQFAVSSLYHLETRESVKRVLHFWDHALIYVLIAGSYSPFALVALRGSTGWRLFAFLWVVAVCGVIFKIKFTGRFNFMSTMVYLAMGWALVPVLKPLSENMSSAGLAWLVIGGISYSVGALIYLCDNLKFNHVVWHMFVLFGGVSHLVAVSTVVSG